MDERLTAIRDFISSREPGVTSFLTTVNRYGDAYVRQVSCLVEHFESGLRLGTIGRMREGDLKSRHLADNPRVTMQWVQTSGEGIGPIGGAARNVTVQADVELVRDADGIRDFLERRSRVWGQPTNLEVDYERYVMAMTPRRLRAEGFSDLFEEIVMLTDFAHPERYRVVNYREGVAPSSGP
jgi:hypothetical protein